MRPRRRRGGARSIQHHCSTAAAAPYHGAAWSVGRIDSARRSIRVQESRGIAVERARAGVARRRRRRRRRRVRGGGERAQYRRLSVSRGASTAAATPQEADPPLSFRIDNLDSRASGGVGGGGVTACPGLRASSQRKTFDSKLEKSSVMICLVLRPRAQSVRWRRASLRRATGLSLAHLDPSTRQVRGGVAARGHDAGARDARAHLCTCARATRVYKDSPTLSLLHLD